MGVFKAVHPQISPSPTLGFGGAFIKKVRCTGWCISTFMHKMELLEISLKAMFIKLINIQIA